MPARSARSHSLWLRCGSVDQCWHGDGPSTFNGDDGANLLVIGGRRLGQRPSAGKRLSTVNGTATTIALNGDDGANLLQTPGTATSITFTGGSGRGSTDQRGTVTAGISFTGDDGANLLQNAGTSAGPLPSVAVPTRTNSSTRAAAATISFTGDDGANLLQNAGTGDLTITFGGGSDADQLINHRCRDGDQL